MSLATPSTTRFWWRRSVWSVSVRFQKTWMNDRKLHLMRINEPLGTITTWFGSGTGHVMTWHAWFCPLHVQTCRSDIKRVHTELVRGHWTRLFPLRNESVSCVEEKQLALCQTEPKPRLVYDAESRWSPVIRMFWQKQRAERTSKRDFSNFKASDSPCGGSRFAYHGNETVVSDERKLSASLNREAVVVFLVTPS